MLKVYAAKYVELGYDMDAVQSAFHLYELAKDDISPESNADREAECRKCLKQLIQRCEEVGLSAAQDLVSYAYDNLPQTKREFEFLIRAVMAELKKTTFFFVPEHLAKYCDLTLQSTITTAFPLASKEVVASGNCLVASLYTASVFHSMRAAEIGMRVLGHTIGVTFPDKPLELAEWQNILDQADSKIKAMNSLQPKQHREEELHFYSQAAIQFRYFKDAWRVRVAHARETYEERPALRVFDHTLEFFEVLATRLKEPHPAV